MKYIGLLILVIASFFAGAYWNKSQLLDSGPVRLKSDLILQSEGNEMGSLPAATILYPYTSSGEITTFVVFVNMKNFNLLEPVSFPNTMTVAPIDGYSD